MSARSDCRRTQIGDIPEEWEVVPIGKIAREVKSRNNLNEDFTVFAITKHAGLVPSLRFFTKRVYSQDLSKYKTIERHQFAYSPIHLNEGAIGLLESEDRGLLSPLHVVFELMPEADEHFFKFLFKSQRLLSSYARLPRGSINRRGAVLFRDFSRINVQLPPRKEQEKIASILCIVDNTIENTDAIIRKTRTLKKGLMQQLLTRGLGHTRFKVTAIGQVPEEWEIVPIAQLGDVVTGSTPPTDVQDYYGNDIPFVSPADLKGSKEIRKTRKRLTRKGLDVARRIPRRSVLVTCISSLDGIGKAGMSSTTCATNQQINSIVCNNDTDPDFIYYCVDYHRQRIRTYAARSAGQFAIISKETFNRVPMPKPPRSEQLGISRILSSFDSKLENELRYLGALEKLKHGLMQVLLTGKARVKVD
jgi:type I restriction enzyme S subunit